MTPFAQLGTLEKRAYAQTTSGINNPYAVEAPAQPAQGAQDSWGWGDTGSVAADMVLGSNPVTGVPYYGAKAVSDLSKGNYWDAAKNVGWGALSFVPFAGSAAKAGVRGTMAASRIGKAYAKANKYARGIPGKSDTLVRAGKNYRRYADAGKRFRDVSMGAKATRLTPMVGYAGIGALPSSNTPPAVNTDNQGTARRSNGSASDQMARIATGNY